MKINTSVLCLAVVGAMLSSVNASTITNLTTFDGTTYTVSDGGAGSLSSHSGSAALVSFIADGVVYSDLTGGTGLSAGSPSTIWEQGGADVGASTAVSDLDLATGTLNPTSGTTFDLSGLSIDASTTFFLFSNGGTPVSSIALRDSGNTTITTDYTGTDFGGPDEVELGGINHSRSGTDLINRVTQGFVFSFDDFTFAAGKTFADVEGFAISSSGADVSDFGIAAIPEPATLGLLGIFGGGILFIRRRCRV